MIKLNNKGFAVSAVLYTLLIAFLLFLGVTLAQFSASTNILNNANKDIINGTEFSVKQVKEERGEITFITYDVSGNEVINSPKDSLNNPMKYTCVEAGTSRGNSWFDYKKLVYIYQNFYWYESPYIVQIKSRYGTMYWPKDFNFDGKNSSCDTDSCTIEENTYKNITVESGTKSGGSIAAISIYDEVKQEYLEENFQIFDICK